MKTYYVYLLSSRNTKSLYTGITNDLQRRIAEHYLDSIGPKKTFAGKYNCIHLVHYEEFNKPLDAIAREKEIKNWRRAKKESLIQENNPNRTFLNDELGIVFPIT